MNLLSFYLCSEEKVSFWKSQNSCDGIFLPTWTRLFSNHDSNYVSICHVPSWIKRVVEGIPINDKFLLDICCILDSRKWILCKSFPPTVDNIKLYFEKNLLSLERVFLQFEDILYQDIPACNNYMFIYMPLTSHDSSFSQWRKEGIGVTLS